MRLDDLTFLFYFLPLFLAVYYITPDKEKALTLLVGSVLFFALQEGVDRWQYAAAIGLVLLTFWLGRWGTVHRWAVPLGLLAVFGVWAAFAVFGEVPVGMRFYALQMAGHLLAVRRGQAAEKELPGYAAQILMFPKLQYGPLVEPGQLMEQVRSPRVGAIRFREGLQDVVIGLSRRVLLADGLGEMADLIGDGALLPLSWVWVVLRAMELYFRFWGCGTMAVGLGKLLGYELPESFREPWSATSVSGFFRRWNVSLWGWLERELGICRGCGQRKWGMLLVMGSFMGLWYGPSRRLLLWGIFIGVLMASEQGHFGSWLRERGGLARAYTLLVVILGWGIFFMDDPGRLLRPGADRVAPRLWPALLAGAWFCSPLPMRWVERYRDRVWFDILLFVAFWICVWFLV